MNDGSETGWYHLRCLNGDGQPCSCKKHPGPIEQARAAAVRHGREYGYEHVEICREVVRSGPHGTYTGSRVEVVKVTPEGS